MEGNRAGSHVFWTQVGQKEEYLQPPFSQREEPIIASWQITCGNSGFKAYFTPELAQIIIQAMSLTEDLSTSKLDKNVPSFECWGVSNTSRG